MKTKYKIIFQLFIPIMLILSSYSLFSAEKLYVFFDDIDEVYNTNGQVLTDAVDQIYWNPLLMNNTHSANLMKTGYASFMNSGKDLLDYEVAIFYMGKKPLQYDGGSGKRVVSQIKRMLDAGKRVILVGVQLLASAYDPNSSVRDTEVQAFFTDYLGIPQDAYLSINTTAGSYYRGFGIKAIQNDPVSKGYKKVCNIAHGPDLGGEILGPWRYTSWIEAIDEDEITNENTIVTEFHTWTWDWFELNTAEKTNRAMGIRAENESNDPLQNSKIAFWCTGFEIASATQSLPNWELELWYALNWCVTDLPKPGPNLQFNVDPLDFGVVAVEDSSALKEFKITNVGRDPLEINDMYIGGFEDYGIFQILTDQLTYTLEPGEGVYIPMKFYPTDEVSYTETIEVESNAANGNLLSLELTGWGGKKPKPGPRLAVVNQTLDFGTIKPNEIDTMFVEMTNPGVDPLYIWEKFYWLNEEKAPFWYISGMSWSITVEPGDTARVPIKFVPGNNTKVFTDTLGIVPSNAVNFKDDTLWITLKGVSSAGGGDNAVSITADKISIDSTELGKTGSSSFFIENTGANMVYISKLEMEDNFGGVYSLWKNDDTEYTKFPIQLPIVGPNKKRNVNVIFKPAEIIDYQTKILIEFMDSDDNQLPELNKTIDVSAFVQDTATSGIPEAISSNGLLSLKLAPNPITEAALLFYTLGGDRAMQLEVFIVDVLGNKVMELFNTNIQPGEYNSPIDIRELSSGVYFIIAASGNTKTKLQIAVMK